MDQPRTIIKIVSGYPSYSPSQTTYYGVRPPVLGATAVAGIIIAALSFVASLLTAGYATGIYLNSNAARDRLLRNAPPTLPVSLESEPVLLTLPLVIPVGTHGVDAAQRPTLIDVVGQKMPMSPEQSRELDALLAEDGAEIFGAEDGQLIQPQAALAAIVRTGPLVLGNSDAVEPFFFETAAGRGEIYSNRALFYRKNNLSPIRATAGRRSNANGHPVLLPQDVDGLLRLVGDTAGQVPSKSTLNEQQLQTLRSLLSDPAQQLVAITAGAEGPALGIQGAQNRPDGFAAVSFGGGPILLAPDGKLILQSDRDAIPAVSTVACTLVIIEGILSIALAVFLLVISIRLLRRPRQKLKIFAVYSIAKMILAMIGGLAMGWMTASFLANSLHPTIASASTIPIAVLAGAAVVVAGYAFPVILMIVATRKSVQEFYEN
jgi:hypothetical protein